MATTLIYADTSDGYLRSDNATYSVARAGYNLTVLDTQSLANCGQAYSGGLYYLYELFLSFDTSSVSSPGLAEVKATPSNQPGGSWNVLAAAYDWGSSIDTGDWQDGTDLAALTPIDATGVVGNHGYPTTLYMHLVPPVDATGWVNAGGTTRLILWSDDQEADSAPSTIENIIVRSADYSGSTSDPFLRVYDTGEGPVPWVAGYAVAEAFDTDAGTTISDIAWDTGDLCLIWCGTDGDNTFVAAGCHIGSTSTPLTALEEVSYGAYCFGGWLYRWIDGTESSDTVYLDFTENEVGNAIVLQIKGVDREFPIVRDTAYGDSTTPDPPNRAALKESRECLNLAAFVMDSNDSYVSQPTNYTLIWNRDGTASGDCGVALAYRETSGSTAENPGSFTIDAQEEWIASTLTILGDLSPVVAELTPYDDLSTKYQTYFGRLSSLQQVCQEFVPRKSCSIQKVAAYLGSVGSPTDDARIGLRTAYDGSDVVSATVDVTTDGWYEVTFGTPYAVTAGTTYYISYTRTGSLSDTQYYHARRYSGWDYLEWLRWSTNNGSDWGSSDISVGAFQVRESIGATVVSGDAAIVAKGATAVSALLTIPAVAAFVAKGGVAASALVNQLADAAIVAKAGVASSGVAFALVEAAAAVAARAGVPVSALLEVLGVSAITARASAIVDSLLLVPGVVSIDADAAVGSDAFLYNLAAAALHARAGVTADAEVLTIVLGAAALAAAAGVSVSAILDVLGVSAIVAEAGLSVSALLEVPGDAAILARAGVSSQGILIRLADAAIQARAQATVAGLVEVLGDAAIEAKGSVSASSLVEVLAAAAIDADAALSASAILDVLGGVAITGRAGIVVSGEIVSQIVTGSVSIDADASVSATALVEILGVAGLAGQAGVVVVGEVLGLIEGDATITARAGVAGTPILFVLADSAIQAKGAVSADAVVFAIQEGVAGITARAGVSADSLLEVLGAAAVEAAAALAASGVVFITIPTGLVANAISSTEIELDWDAMGGIDGYDIERDDPIILIVGLATNEYTDDGLDPDTMYGYRVRSVRWH